MTPRKKALWMLLVTSFLTVLPYFFLEMEPFPKKSLPIIWIFCSWNFFAYGFGRDMWPWQLVELKGNQEGSPAYRALHFWGTGALYLAFLAAVALSNQ